MKVKLCRDRFMLWIYLSIFLQPLVYRKHVAAESEKASIGTDDEPVITTERYDHNNTSRIYTEDRVDEVDTAENITVLQRLIRDLFKGYDKDTPPIFNHQDYIDIQIDLTYRQVIDMNEKNQVLKSLIWYRQYWIDANLKWKPKEYEGITHVSIPATKIWRPDIAVYEEVSARSLTPRLPFVRVLHTGEIMFAEPTILETSCSVNTAFFPFDTQICSITFVSWTQTVKNIDVRARRNPEALDNESRQLFINSGEWVLERCWITKQIATYYTVIQRTGESSENEVSEKSYAKMPPTQRTTAAHVGKNLTHNMYAELVFAVMLRRNPSLYLQSMLFPSVALTTVAVFGFFLPPNSGERVGLQIIILLTFMVFLLTVGEMFPASTGPYIGVYFVISMVQLGVNIAMTIFVLHLHFKPCVRNKSTWMSQRPRWFTMGGETFEGESLIPVRYRRVLQFLSKICGVADDEAAWMLPISNPDSIHEGTADDKAGTSNVEAVIKTSIENSDLDYVTEGPGKRPTDVRAGVVTDEGENAATVEKTTVHKAFGKFRSQVDKVMEDIRAQKEFDQEYQDSLKQERQEWKSVARMVDKLFFRVYIFMLVASYVGLGIVAICGDNNLASGVARLSG